MLDGLSESAPLGLQDIVSLQGPHAPEWLVIGWFTPDYRPLAQNLAFSLSEHGSPFHLFAKPKLEAGWNTTRKPSVVLEAMDAYPGKTLVLMDVDCIVRGDISPVASIASDVGIAIIARNMHNGKGYRHWIAVEASSRVVVFRPTEGARMFAHRWREQIERSGFNHDEHAMIWAFLKSMNVDFSYVDQAYSGREISLLPDAVIVHDSAHERQRQQRGGFKGILRAIERPFRTGRTKATKLRSEMSVMIQE